MKGLLKYLIGAVVVAIAFLGAFDGADCCSDDCEQMPVTAELTTHYLVPSPSDFDLSLPRQSSSTSSLRLHSQAKRPTVPQKNNLEFVKVGKIVNAAIVNYIQRDSFNIKSSFVKPAFRLISLGKLII